MRELSPIGFRTGFVYLNEQNTLARIGIHLRLPFIFLLAVICTVYYIVHRLQQLTTLIKKTHVNFSNDIAAVLRLRRK